MSSSTTMPPRTIRWPASARTFPTIRIIESSRNVGFCIANNRMVDAARGPFILLLNNDAVLRPGSLQALVHGAQKYGPDCVLGLPQHTLYGGTLVDRGYRSDPFLNPIPIMEAGDHDAGIVTGACLWTTKRIWEAVGGLPDFFESLAEDIHFCVAARLLGYRVAVLDSPPFDHWVGKNLGAGNWSKTACPPQFAAARSASATRHFR